MIYQWREDGWFRTGSAQRVGERLEAIRLHNNGALTTEVVLNDAKNKKSVLNKYFTWDDSKAAQEFRKEEARRLIGSVAVVFADEVDGAPTEPIRAFSSVRGDKGAPTYQSTLEAMQSPTLRASIMEQALNELRGWERRYKNFQELAAAVDGVKAAILTLDSVTRAGSAHATAAG